LFLLVWWTHIIFQRSTIHLWTWMLPFWRTIWRRTTYEIWYAWTSEYSLDVKWIYISVIRDSVLYHPKEIYSYIKLLNITHWMKQFVVVVTKKWNLGILSLIYFIWYGTKIKGNHISSIIPIISVYTRVYKGWFGLYIKGWIWIIHKGLVWIIHKRCIYSWINWLYFLKFIT
jgi:hypothetical protein